MAPCAAKRNNTRPLDFCSPRGNPGPFRTSYGKASPGIAANLVVQETAFPAMHSLTLVILTFIVAHGAGAAGAPEDAVLAAGNPPLTQSVADAWQRLVEFAFDTTLSDEGAKALRDRLVAVWREADNPMRDRVTGAPQAWVQIGQATGPRRELMHLSLRDELVTAAEAKPDEPANKLVLDLWNAKSAVLAPGDPPLRRSSVQALLALFEWLVARSLGQDVQLTEAEKDEFTRRIVSEYPQAPPGDRMLLAGTEAVLPWIELEWERASPEARARFAANVSGLLGVQPSFLPAPYAGELDTWKHPDGLFELSYPKDWPARYGALAPGASVADWIIADVTVLGEAPAEALELGALPTAGAVVAVAALPPSVRDGKASLGDALTSLSSELLARTGRPEPVSGSARAANAALLVWRQTEPAATYTVWVSAVAMPQAPGAAVVTIARAPLEAEAQYAPAFSRIIHSLRLGQGGQSVDAPNARDAARELLAEPLGKQMDLIEGLTTGVR